MSEETKKKKQKVKHKPGQYLLSHQANDKPDYVRKTDNEKMGRPSTFKEEYCDDIVQFMSKGKSLAQWITKHGLREGQMKRWTSMFPKFREAKDRAILANMAYWEDVGERATVGEIPRFHGSTYRFMMKNRFPHVYKDVHHTEQTTTIKFETFVNETGQIQQSSSDDMIEGEVIDHHKDDD